MQSNLNGSEPILFSFDECAWNEPQTFEPRPHHLTSALIKVRLLAVEPVREEEVAQGYDGATMTLSALLVGL